MGCAASRQKYDSAIIAEAKPTPQISLPGSAVLAQPNTFQIAQKLFRMREDYDLKDADGKVVGKLLGKMFSLLRDKQILSDANGKKVLLLQRKFATLAPTFFFYSYSPAYKGQESSDTDGDEKLYLFAELQTIMFSMPSRWNYLVYQGEGAPTKVGEAASLCQMIYDGGVMNDIDGTAMFKFTQKSLFSGGAAGYEIEVAPGVDPLQAIAICIAAPQTLEN